MSVRAYALSKPLLTLCAGAPCIGCLQRRVGWVPWRGLSPWAWQARAHTHTLTHTHTLSHRGGSAVAGGGQNPAAFSYLWPIKSHVIWWLTLMGNGWNPSLSSSLIVSTLNGATVKLRWCHHVRSPLVATVQHLTFKVLVAAWKVTFSNRPLLRSGEEIARNVWVIVWGIFYLFSYGAGSFFLVRYKLWGFNDEWAIGEGSGRATVKWRLTHAALQ